METSSQRPPVGQIERAMLVIRVLASAGARGVPLSALADVTRLAPSTVHRLLTKLIRERVVRQVADSRCYALGPVVYELGLAAARQFDMRAICRPAVERLAHEAGDTVYVVIRSGDEAVCIDRQEGPSPIRVLTLQPGSRRPLGLGAGGLAILAHLPDDERASVLAVVAPIIVQQYQFAARALRDSLEVTRRQGVALIRNRVTAGVTAMGMPFRDTLGHCLGAVSVAGINARMTQTRVDAIKPLLATAVREIERSIARRVD